MGALNGLCVVTTGALLAFSSAAMGQETKTNTDQTTAIETTPAGGTRVTETTTVEISETYAPPYLGQKDTWVLGAENVAGFGWTKQIADQDKFGKRSTASFNLFGRSTTANEAQLVAGATNVLDGPRLTLDAFPIEGLSLGGTLMFNFDDASTASTSSAFGIAFRVGYALELSELIAFWPKVGIQFGYGFVDEKKDILVPEAKIANLDLNIQAPFVFTITNQAGLTLTPGVALPLLSQAKVAGENDGNFGDSSKFLQVFGTLGVITWF